MSYIDGFVIPVPKANKQAFIDHARLGDSVFMDLGATRVLECWDDERMDPAKNPMPFDGKRLIYGGFAPVVVLEK